MQFYIEKRELKIALQGCRRAICKNSTRINLQGIHVFNAGQNVIFEATDGYQLARYTSSPEILSGKGDWLISTDQVKQLAGLCKGKGGLTFTVPENGIWVVSDEKVNTDFEFTEVSKFPQMENVLPKKYAYTLEFEQPELLAAFKAIAKMSNEKIKPMAIRFRDDTICIESEKTEDAASMEYRVDWQGTRPDSGAIGLNAVYALNALASVKGSRIGMQYNGPLNPLTFISNGIPNFFYLIMPLRIDWYGKDGCKFLPAPGEVKYSGLKREAPNKPVIVTAGDTLAEDLRSSRQWFTDQTPIEPETAQAEESGADGIVIAEYSEKAVIITGNTFPHADRIKSAVPKSHGLWHRGARGWLFSKKHEIALRAALADILAA